MTYNTFQYDSPAVYNTNLEYDAFAPSNSYSAPVVLAHLSATLSLNGDGSFQFLVQDTLDEVAQSVEMIVGTVVGERTVVPQFGIPDPTFNPPTKGVVQNAINQFETRALANVEITPNDNGTSHIGVNVALAQGATP